MNVTRYIDYLPPMPVEAWKTAENMVGLEKVVDVSQVCLKNNTNEWTLKDYSIVHWEFVFRIPLLS